MPENQQSRKYLLVNSETMGSLALDEYQMRLIILGLTAFTEPPDSQPAADLADTIANHMMGAGILERGGGGSGFIKVTYKDTKKAVRP